MTGKVRSKDHLDLGKRTCFSTGYSEEVRHRIRIGDDEMKATPLPSRYL